MTSSDDVNTVSELMDQQMDAESSTDVLGALDLVKIEDTETPSVSTEMTDQTAEVATEQGAEVATDLCAEGATVAIDEGAAGDHARSVRTSARLLRSPVKKAKLGSVKQAPDYKQDELFCTKVQVELFCCNFCETCFETLDEIKKHLQEQPEHRAPRQPKEKPFKCKTCGRGYASNLTLNKHVRKMHRKPPVRKPKKKTEEEELVEAKKEEEEEKKEEEELDDSANDEDYVTRTGTRTTRSGSSRKSVKCEECGLSCPTSSRLKIHMTIHNGDAGFECDQCSELFVSQWLLKQHLKKEHGVDRKSSGRGVPSLECDMCEHVADNMIEFRKHQLTHKGQEISCRVCGRSAVDFRRLRKHFRQQHRPGKKWRVCDICGHKSSGPSSLTLHMATHTGVRKYKCETCGMRFVRKYAMERHNEVKHLQIRRYTCEHCGQKFGTNFALQKHEEYHNELGEKKFFCETCGEGFIRDNVLRWHLQYYHGSNPKSVVGRRLPFDRNRGPVPGLDSTKRELPFPCSLCKRSFSSHAVRERHIRAFHSDDTSLLCKVCGVRFGAQGKYDLHVASHNGMTSHKCRFCEKEFKRDHLRQVHESEKHTGARPWKCTCCEEKFISKARMYAHRLVHYGREIKCDYCDRNFASLPLKKRHMRKHTGFKEFQCQICNKEYKQKSNYAAHMKIHTGEKPFQCDQCEERFVDLPTLRKHLNYHQPQPQLQQHHHHHQQQHQQQQPQQQQQQQQQQHHQQQQQQQQLIPQQIQIQHQGQPLDQHQTVQIIPQHLPQSVQPVQHLQIIQHQHLQQHDQQQQQQQQQQHHIIRGPIMQQQGGQIQQLTTLPQTGESIDLVAYNCDVCGQMFLSTEALIAHCQTHVLEAAHGQRPVDAARQSGGLSLFGVVSEASQYY